MQRKKVTIQARELSDMDISRISLVKRGANRIPFRIVKSSDGESNMLDLTKLFFAKKDAAVLPAVIAIALAKGADVEAYTKALTEAGFEVDHVNETDDANTLMFTKSDDLADMVAYKISDDCVLVIEGITKGIQAWPDSNSFVENITKAGFAPSYRIANEILSETVGNIMFSEGDADETKAAVSKALSDFSGYVEAVMSTIPVQAFKAEAAIITVEKGMLNEQVTADSLKAKAKEDKKKGKKAPAAEAESTDETETKSETESSETVAETTGDDVVAEKTGDAEAETDSNAELVTALAGLTEAVGAIKSSVDSVEEKLSTRMDGLEKQVKKTDEALAGTVHSEEAEDDASPKKADVKKDGDAVSWDSVLDFGEGVEVS
jgi:hypothetical protein